MARRAARQLARPAAARSWCQQQRASRCCLEWLGRQARPLPPSRTRAAAGALLRSPPRCSPSPQPSQLAATALQMGHQSRAPARPAAKPASKSAPAAAAPEAKRQKAAPLAAPAPAAQPPLPLQPAAASRGAQLAAETAAAVAGAGADVQLPGSGAEELLEQFAANFQELQVGLQSSRHCLCSVQSDSPRCVTFNQPSTPPHRALAHATDPACTHATTHPIPH